MHDVFISYSRKDSGSFVQFLVERLELCGVSTFYDQVDIAVGQPLIQAIERAVDEARYVLVVMSPEYFASQWATQEWQMAMAQESSRRENKVIPILYRDCDIPPILAAKVYADFRTEDAFEQNFPKLLEILHPNYGPGSFGPVLANPPFGSVEENAANSPALAAMIAELQSKVELFLEVNTAAKQSPSQVKIDAELCFVAMPFGSEELNDIYNYFVKPSIEKHCDMKCQRGDDMFGSNPIMDDVRQSIQRSRIVVADLTGRNPNVFYEVGIAHTLKKDVLLLSQSMNDVPFDVRHLRVLVYDATPRGCKQLEEKVAENVNAILRGGT